MSKIHINSDGNPSECKAQKGRCPFSKSEHFDSIEEANAFVDNRNKSRYGIINNDIKGCVDSYREEIDTINPRQSDEDLSRAINAIATPMPRPKTGDNLMNIVLQGASMEYLKSKSDLGNTWGIREANQRRADASSRNLAKIQEFYGENANYDGGNTEIVPNNEEEYNNEVNFIKASIFSAEGFSDYAGKSTEDNWGYMELISNRIDRIKRPKGVGVKQFNANKHDLQSNVFYMRMALCDEPLDKYNQRIDAIKNIVSRDVR